MERVRDSLRRLRERRKPRWTVGEEDVKQPPLRSVSAVLLGWWVHIRGIFFRVLATLTAVIDLLAVALLWSNVWYMNLLVCAYAVPNFLIMIHYLRLTGARKV